MSVHFLFYSPPSQISRLALNLLLVLPNPPSPLPQCWDYRHLTPHPGFCGAEAGTQGFVRGRQALSQSSCTLQYLHHSHAVCTLFCGSFQLCAVSSPASCVYNDIRYYRPTWLFYSILKNTHYDFWHVCGIHVCGGMFVGIHAHMCGCQKLAGSVIAYGLLPTLHIV